MPETTAQFRFILPKTTNKQVLLHSTQVGWRLPKCQVSGTDKLGFFDAAIFNSAMGTVFGAEVRTRYPVDAHGTGQGPRIVVFDNLDPTWDLQPPLEWVNTETLSKDTFCDEQEALALIAWCSEQSASASSVRLMPWSRPGWFAEAINWVEAQLGEKRISIDGEMEQLRSWHVSSVMRIPTQIGDVYFKANPSVYVREVAIMERLSQHFPARLPSILAADSERGWMLTKDMGGQDLETVSDVSVWEEAIQIYAQMQRESISLVQGRLGDVLYDWTPEVTPAFIEHAIMEASRWLDGYPDDLTDQELERLQALVPRLKRLAKAPTEYGVPCTLVHGDFRAGNVRITERGPIFFDWAWSCVSHPFVDTSWLSYISRWLPVDEGRRLRDVYLEAWTLDESPKRLQELYELIDQWKLLLGIGMDVDWVQALQQALGSQSVIRRSSNEWVLRHRQYYLLRMFRKLLSLPMTR